MTELQSDYLKQATELWNQSLSACSPRPTKPPAAPITDRRFAAPEWAPTPSPAFTAQMYLLNARTLMQMAEAMQGDAKTKARVRFAVQQWVDATSPANFLALNPEAQKKALDTKGESIAQGLQHLLQRPAARATCRRPTRACSRSAATSPPPRAPWCSRTSCSS